MTAPALVLLAAGSPDSAAVQIAHGLRKRMQILRPTITVQVAFAQHCSPSPSNVVSSLVNRGTSEIVLVPLTLTHAIEQDATTSAVVKALHTAHPDVRLTAARPLGPATELLNVLDERLRAALRAAHAVELDGLVLAAAGVGDLRGNALVARRARQWAAHHKLPCTVAMGDGSGPSAAQAMASLRSSGRRHIAVGNFALGDDDLHQHQTELALAAGAVAVSAPLGVDDRILDIAMARYSWAAMSLLDDDAATHGDVKGLSLVAND